MARRYGESAKTLTWGLGLLVSGVVIAFWVRDPYLAAGNDGLSSGFDGLVVVVACLSAVVGLVTTLIGVWQLATNVDIAALAARDAAVEAELAQQRADREAAEKAAARARLTTQLAQEE